MESFALSNFPNSLQHLLLISVTLTSRGLWKFASEVGLHPAPKDIYGVEIFPALAGPQTPEPSSPQALKPPLASCAAAVLSSAVTHCHHSALPHLPKPE